MQIAEKRHGRETSFPEIFFSVAFFQRSVNAEKAALFYPLDRCAAAAKALANTARWAEVVTYYTDREGCVKTKAEAVVSGEVTEEGQFMTVYTAGEGNCLLPKSVCLIKAE